MIVSITNEIFEPKKVLTDIGSSLNNLLNNLNDPQLYFEQRDAINKLEEEKNGQIEIVEFNNNNDELFIMEPPKI